ncbi:hypothetical protein, partial [Nitrincola nitratireducens]|uniref:hypothetical protein n=2 Tax=Nitrincola TaxID=267849 RepID=UPI00055C0FAB
MKNNDLHQYNQNLNTTRPLWVKNPNSKTNELWVLVKKFLLFFIISHSIVILISLTLGLKHSLTLFYFSLTVLVPTAVLTSAIIQSKRAEPDDLLEINLATWLFRVFVMFGANIALIVSTAFDIFPLIFSALLIACVVIELMAYLTYRSYSDDMIREIIEERKMFSPVNENKEFWFLNRGGDVGSDRLFIKGKWHLRLLYVLAYIAPFGVLSGGKAIGAYLVAFAAIAIYFMAHGLFTGYYVTRRG